MLQLGYVKLRDTIEYGVEALSSLEPMTEQATDLAVFRSGV